MAIIPKNDYTGRINSADPEYPQGKAINIIGTTAGTGTPVEEKWLNDDWGFKQEILSEAGITPSGVPDKVGSSQYLEGIKKVVNVNDLSQTYTFPTVAAMQSSTVVFTSGKNITTGQGVWRVNTNKGLAIAGGLKASPLNGVFVNDCGGKGDSLFRDNTTGIWYVDVGLTVASSDDTAAFVLAMTATGGTDSKGTINFGEGGYHISPETVDINGIDIRQKTLKGLGYETSTIVQSGNNTYQTLFRNNPKNLSEAGAWGSGGKYRIHDIALRGNWDGASDQTVTTPPSGNGNGLIGIAKVDYDFDAQGGILQLISSTRFEFINIKVTHGYGHNIKLYRGGYSLASTGFINSCRGSGIWIAGDGYTSSPIEKIKFETCRGGYGALFANGVTGSTISKNLFEGQPYGIYMEIANDVLVDGNYMEAHYSEDFYKNPGCWGITDIGNYEFNLVDPRVKNYKGYFGYRRDFGLHVNTDSATEGTRPADINKFYMQRDSIGHGIQPAPLLGTGGVYQQAVKQLATGGGGSIEWYTSIKHTHNDTDDSGAAEIRFKRNLNQNSWGGLGFATYDGVSLSERWEIGKSGDLVPSVNNSVSIGSGTKLVSNIFVNLPIFADEAAAVALPTGQMYKTATGEVRVKL